MERIGYVFRILWNVGQKADNIIIQKFLVNNGYV